MEIPVLTANSVNPDQTPHSAGSDLGLHCLLMSLSRDARHKWVKVFKMVYILKLWLELVHT